MVLAIAATSADVERLFSTTGRILTKYRSSLSVERVDMMTPLHGWLKDDFETTYGKSDKRAAAKRARINQKLAPLNARMEIIPPEEVDGEDDAISDDEQEPNYQELEEDE